MKDPVNDAARKRQRGKITTEAGAGDVTGAPTKHKGKYMHTIDHGNDQRRPEDGPVDIKGKFKAWPGVGS